MNILSSIKTYATIVFFILGCDFMVGLNVYPNPLIIAHAGGGFDGNRYTNSLEALESNYAKGFRYFEIDFSWTSDQKLVCLHDWGKRFKLNFGYGYSTKTALSLQQFKDLLEKQESWHPCTLDTLSDWVSLHKDSFIITDVKYDNINAIKQMAKNHPDLIKNLIPQFYQPEEYKILKDMGFNKLIWILYQFEGKKSHINELVKEMDLVAISMRASQAKKKWAQSLIKNHQSVFVYTVNNLKELNKLTKKYGVTGFYTDFLPAIIP